MRRRRSRIRVEGAGIAGLCAALLLARRGCDIVRPPPQKSRARVVAMPADTVALLCALWEIEPRDLGPGVATRARRVDWEAGGRAVMGHPALILDTADVAARLERALPRSASARENAEADWTIDARGVPPQRPRAGLRQGLFAHADYDSARHEIAVTATDGGWLFTAPDPRGGTVILAVAPDAASMPDAAALSGWLKRAGHSGAARSLGAVGAPVPVAPAFSEAPPDADMFPAGDALLAMDPVRGDGTGHAVRGALLAQACVAVIDAGADAARVRAHFRARMRAVWVSHLTSCIDIYGRARAPKIWAPDITLMHARVAAADRDFAPFEFRLLGRDLAAA